MRLKLRVAAPFALRPINLIEVPRQAVAHRERPLERFDLRQIAAVNRINEKDALLALQGKWSNAVLVAQVMAHAARLRIGATAAPCHAPGDATGARDDFGDRLHPVEVIVSA